MYIMNMHIFHQGLPPCQLVLPSPGRALPRGLPCVDLLLPRLPCPCLPLHRSYQVPLEGQKKLRRRHCFQVQGCDRSWGFFLYPHMDPFALGQWPRTDAGDGPSYFLTIRKAFRCFSTSHVVFQVMQVAYGIATSTEVAYFTYIYAKISGEHYRLVCKSWVCEKLAKMRPGYKLDKGLSPTW